ncbi:TDP-N-acetylfucosamine:lipid II N-acetylfucosaminyltransferase [Thorsellia kenyensis]|uniref:TDP-N-acetylfucosamine:lipid II N-acetylfucosaminyltransferase n=1 Tax=Thorsellia kenyensis TaxID=1549888 RepID=A0ABV6CAR4_9GAMM
MTTLVHILGSPISHHTATVLAFFQRYHEKYLQDHDAIEFLVAYDPLESIDLDAIALKHLNLKIHFYPGKKALAAAFRQHYLAYPTVEYFLHGQFNPTIWLDILLGKIDPKRLKWHVWGADLYEEEKSLKYKLFYIMRRLAQAKIGQIYSTKGDARILKSRISNPKTSTLYFPTKMNLSLTPTESQKQQRLDRLKEKYVQDRKTVLLGNSGDKTNNHILGLTKLYKTFGSEVKVIIPMGYPLNNKDYINKVKQHAASLFSDENVHILEEKIEFSAYLECLESCDLAYFLFERQQGIGTISLCIQLAVPFVLHPLNAFIDDLKEENIPYLTIKDNMSYEQICDTQTKLNQLKLNKISFFEPNYLGGWHQALGLLKED